MKEHIRIAGFDDGPFSFEDERCIFAGVLMRMPGTVEGISISSVEVDGTDSALRTSEMLEREGWNRLAHAVMVDGASMGGFNLVYTDEIVERTGVPAMTVTHERPDMNSMMDAMKEHFQDWEKRFDWLKSREVHEVEVNEGTVFISFSGIELEEAKALVRKAIVHGLTPEPVRLAHMIARAVVRHA